MVKNWMRYLIKRWTWGRQMNSRYNGALKDWSLWPCLHAPALACGRLNGAVGKTLLLLATNCATPCDMHICTTILGLIVGVLLHVCHR